MPRLFSQRNQNQAFLPKETSALYVQDTYNHVDENKSSSSTSQELLEEFGSTCQNSPDNPPPVRWFQESSSLNNHSAVEEDFVADVLRSLSNLQHLTPPINEIGNRLFCTPSRIQTPIFNTFVEFKAMCKLEPYESLLTLIHLYRYSQKTNTKLHGLNIHYLLLASMLCTLKYFSDNPLKNGNLAEHLFFEKSLLNKLEVEFLNQMDWDMEISYEDYQTFLGDKALFLGCFYYPPEEKVSEDLVLEQAPEVISTMEPIIDDLPPLEPDTDSENEQARKRLKIRN